MIIECFRGQHGTGEAKIHTRLPSVSFSSLEAAMAYATEPNNHADVVVESTVLKASISINNPVLNNDGDCFIDFADICEKLGVDFAWEMALKHEGWITCTGNWCDNFSEFVSLQKMKEIFPERISELYMDAFPLLDDGEFVHRAISKGYDGAIHYGNGETYDTLEYRIFSQDQILSLNVINA